MTSSRPPSSADAATRRYGTVSRLFHWGTALLVLLMIPAGIAMTSSGFESISNQLFIFHKGTGAVLLVLVVLRILWRVTHAPPPPPPGMSATQARLADWTHSFLYLLLLVMTVSGYVRVVGGGYPIELLDRLGVPPLLPEMEDVAERASVLHKFTAYLFTAVISAHIAAAVHHGLQHRSGEGSGILGRMWPPMGGGS
jgi:cytochrome b561